MCHSCCAQIVNTSSGDGSIKTLSGMGLHNEKQRREDPHGRSLLPYKMSKVKPRADGPCPQQECIGRVCCHHGESA